MRDLMTGLKKMGAMAFVAAVLGFFAATPAAQAANALERNFWLSGPRYDGEMGSCGDALAARPGRAARSLKRAPI